MSSNLSVLTKSHKIIASKKRARREQIKEVVFDDDARREFLTGFHKRKVEKKENAKKKAQEREKQERLEARREKRKMLAEQAVQNAQEVEKAYGAIIDGEDDSGTALPATRSKGKQKAEIEDEYEDEEQLATVTVVEDFDPEALLHAPVPTSKRTDVDGTDRSSLSRRQPEVKPKSHVTPSVDVKKTHAKVAKKAKDIKYQTKSARNAERTKQRRRKVEKAERAGGKASRKSPKGRSKR
ncbi:unnamed protein product [Somion occarium]|uniref:Nucleolar protein 12 n=1 Tax=Somion occarium TaxID=3059160 RepID=A0ABP1DK67_9APHY